jgi:hypothetical protein
MPIEIKELIIKATVTREAEDSEARNTSSATGGSNVKEEKLVERCVEQVLEILRIRNER